MAVGPAERVDGRIVHPGEAVEETPVAALAHATDGRPAAACAVSLLHWQLSHVVLLDPR
jgi:hypothetical protein